MMELICLMKDDPLALPMAWEAPWDSDLFLSTSVSLYWEYICGTQKGEAIKYNMNNINVILLLSCLRSL